jgi:phospholipase/carboxylesterase
MIIIHKQLNFTSNIFLIIFITLLGCQCDRKNAEPTTTKKIASTSSPLQSSQIIQGRPSSKAPTVFAIHGLGDTPDNFLTMFTDVKINATIIAPQAPISHYSGYSWFEKAVPLAASCPLLITQEVNHAAQLLCDFIKIQGNSKNIITGFSQGGVLAFAVALTCPHLLTCSLPIAGMLPTEFIKKHKKPTSKPKIIAFHGKTDSIITHSSVKKTVENIKEINPEIELKSYPFIGHYVDEQMQKDIEQTLNKCLKL